MISRAKSPRHVSCHLISSLLPSSYLVELSRDIVLRGALGADVAAKIAIIVAFAVVLLVGGFLDVRRSLGRR